MSRVTTALLRVDAGAAVVVTPFLSILLSPYAAIPSYVLRNDGSRMTEACSAGAFVLPAEKGKTHYCTVTDYQ